MMTVADPAVGDPATATPSRIFFSFFLSRNEKKRVYSVSNMLPKSFFDHDRHLLTDFLNPALDDDDDDDG